MKGVDKSQQKAVLAWDKGEVYGKADPATLPSPTTVSLARTVLMWRGGAAFAHAFAMLDIRDAERAQGLEAGYTELPADVIRKLKLTPTQVVASRFKCVGNALPGKVRSQHFAQISFVHNDIVFVHS